MEPIVDNLRKHSPYFLLFRIVQGRSHTAAPHATNSSLWFPLCTFTATTGTQRTNKYLRILTYAWCGMCRPITWMSRSIQDVGARWRRNSFVGRSRGTTRTLLFSSKERISNCRQGERLLIATLLQLSLVHTERMHFPSNGPPLSLHTIRSKCRLVSVNLSEIPPTIRQILLVFTERIRRW